MLSRLAESDNVGEAMNTSRLTYRCPHCGAPMELERATDEVLTCPAPQCGKPFKAEVPTATPVTPIILPHGTDSMPEEDKGEVPPAAVPVAQPAAEREDQIEVVHLDMLRRYPFRCLAYGGMALAGLVGVFWFGLDSRPFWMVLSTVLLAFALYRLIPWWLRMRHTTLTITTRRCLVETGLFSKKAEAFPFDHLTDVHVNQGLLSRFLNVGDIVLSSNHGDSKQVVLMAVPDPDRVAGRMRERH